MSTLRAVCLSAWLLSPALAQAAAPPPAAPAAPREAVPAAQWLAEAFGPAGLEVLRARGYVVLQGRPGAYRLKAVDWKHLELLSRSAQAAADLAAAVPRLRQGQALAPAGPLPFLSLRGLPPGGLVTPPLHALIDALEATHDEWTALAGASTAPLSGTRPNLYQTAWGSEFARGTRAELLQDPAPLVERFFETCLAGVRAEPGAAEHLIAASRERYQVDVSSRLAADVRTGAPSQELSRELRRYLGDERRVQALLRIRAQAAQLERKTSLLRDLRDLEAVASVFRGRPALMTELEGAVHAAPAAGGPPELTSAGLHLQRPAALGQDELGDAVTVSGAYWVDGLPDGAKAAVEETTYRDTPEGLRDIETRTVKRGNGGPYAFSRRIVLTGSEAFALRSVVAAPTGNSLEDSLPVPAGKDFELALLKLAAADDRALACQFPDADQAYAKVAESIAEAAREKPQYERLLAAVRQRRALAERDAAALAEIEKAAAAARPDADPGRCRYDLKRTEAAMARTRALPPGCDRLLVDLRRQRRLISRRAADQETFAASSGRAAGLRRACRFEAAAEDWARGLAVLDADPAARCGATAEAALRAEADLEAALAEGLWRDAFALELAQASAEPGAAGRLERSKALVARIGTLPDPGCFSAERRRAEALARAAGEALAPRDGLASGLASDPQALAAVSGLAAQRRRLLAEAAARQTKQAAEQVPVGPGRPPQGAKAPERAVP